MRTNEFLEERLYEIWENNFADVPRQNLVLIFFGKYSRRQLGCIKWAYGRSKIKSIYKKYEAEHKIQDDERISLITITKYYSHLEIPEFVLNTTISHELVHYTHGFHSPLPQIYKHPHKGDVVNKELRKRGLGEQLDQSEEWLNKNWYNFIKQLQKK